MDGLFDITYGPFRTKYHIDVVGPYFEAAVETFIQHSLLPQVDHATTSITGIIEASFNEDRYCGPRSAVRNLFLWKLTFRGKSAESTIRTKLQYSPITHDFALTPGSSLYVWTPNRRQCLQNEREAVQQSVTAILDGRVDSQRCPRCSTALVVTNNTALLDVTCPNRCFKYNLLKDYEEMPLYRHFFMSDPTE